MEPSHLKKIQAGNYEDKLEAILINEKNVDKNLIHLEREDYGRRLLPEHLKESSSWKKKPTTVNIELVNKCNYHCSMCYTVNHEGVKEQLSKAELFDIIDQVNDMGVFTLMLGMGSEATLHPDLLEVLKYASSKIPDVILFTNGSRIKEGDVQKFIDTGITRICISLDAASQETYTEIRGGNLDYVENIINKFVELKTSFGRPLVRVSFCSQTKNKHEESVFREKWINKVDSVEIQRVRELHNLPFLPKIDKDSGLENKFSDHQCFRPFSYLTVWSNGQISPCCSFHGLNLNMGNVRESSMSDAWSSNFANDLRNQFLTSEINPVCHDCLYNTFS